MGDLISFKKELLSKAQGIRNFGNTCYMNSLIQCLLSCTSIYQVLKENQHKDHIKNNTLAQHLLALYSTANSGESIEKACINIWKDILAISQKRDDRVKMNFGGQQDSHEGLLMILDVMDTIPEVYRLFEHRHKILIKCDKCNKVVMNKAETGSVIDVQSDLKSEQLAKFKDIDQFYETTQEINAFIKKQNSFVDKDYICPNPECKQRGEKFKTTILTMAPEILPIVIKKYNSKCSTNFPAKLEFDTENNTKKLVYVLVAQSEHGGSMFGGHYWATCVRQNEINPETLSWKRLNDSTVSDANPGSTQETYIIFYHYLHTVDVNK